MSRVKRNDWICPKCRNDVFGSKDKCGKCECFRSKAGRPIEVVHKPGDWECSKCHEHNFASRSSCRKCSELNPNAKKDGQPPMKPGDWFCSCNEMNFGSRTACHKCGTERAGHKVKNNDSCGICLTEPARVTIKTCGHFVMCQECAQKFTNCPMCRTSYNPLRDLQITYISI